MHIDHARVQRPTGLSTQANGFYVLRAERMVPKKSEFIARTFRNVMSKNGPSAHEPQARGQTGTGKTPHLVAVRFVQHLAGQPGGRGVIFVG